MHKMNEYELTEIEPGRFALVELFGPTGAGHRPVAFFSIGDRRRSPHPLAHTFTVLRAWNECRLPWILVRQEGGAFDGETFRWSARSLLGMVEPAEDADSRADFNRTTPCVGA